MISCVSIGKPRIWSMDTVFRFFRICIYLWVFWAAGVFTYRCYYHALPTRGMKTFMFYGLYSTRSLLIVSYPPSSKRKPSWDSPANLIFFPKFHSCKNTVKSTTQIYLAMYIYIIQYLLCSVRTWLDWGKCRAPHIQYLHTSFVWKKSFLIKSVRCMN